MKEKNSKLVYSTHPEFVEEEEETESEVASTRAETLKLYLDRKNRAGKAVTVVEGFHESEERLNEIARMLKSLCACGGTVKNSTVEIQGDHRDKIEKKLKSLGYKLKRSGG